MDPSFGTCDRILIVIYMNEASQPVDLVPATNEGLLLMRMQRGPSPVHRSKLRAQRRADNDEGERKVARMCVNLKVPLHCIEASCFSCKLSMTIFAHGDAYDMIG